MSIPYFTDYPEARSIRELLSVTVAKFKERPAFSYRIKPSDAEAVRVSHRALLEDVRKFGTEAVARGMSGAHCALVGKLSYPFVVTYLSLLSVGAVLVPLDGDWNADTLADTVQKADCKFLFCGAEVAGKTEQICAAAGIDAPVFLGGENSGFEAFLQSGADRIAAGDNSYSRVPVDPEALSLLVFTSGTTGKGKGVMLSQKALLANVTGALSLLRIGKKTVAVLPPHHTFGSTIGLLTPLCAGMEIYISSGIKYLLHEMKSEKPDWLVLVPLYLETFRRKILATAADSGKDKLLGRTMKFSNVLRRVGVNASAKLFSSVLSVFGGNLDAIVCGGAPLSGEVLKFFTSLGITVLNGYGITECAPLISVNRRGDETEGSVGVPIPWDKVKIESFDGSGEGEICVSGPNVMLGYYKDEEATAACMDGDGYFHTGDIGKIDDKGHLYITGRLKNLIILSNGKNIYPEEIESELSTIPGVLDVVVYEGESARGTQYNLTVAEFFMDADYLAKNKIEDVKKYLQPYVSTYNKNAVPYKKVNMIRVREEEFPKNTLRKIMRFQLDRSIE